MTVYIMIYSLIDFRCNRGENKNDVGFLCVISNVSKDKDDHKKQYQKILKNFFQTCGSRILYLFLVRFGIKSKSDYQFPAKKNSFVFSNVLRTKMLT